MLDLSSLEQVAITGATGFIGCHLVHELASAGCTPILFARTSRNDRWVTGQEKRVRWVELDITETGRVQEALQNLKPRVLIHLAGTRGRGDVRGAEVACEELNVGATVNLLRAAMVTGVQRIVIVGSAEEYGNQRGLQHEALPARATSTYGISKARVSKQAMRMHSEEDCPVVIVRPFSVYGPGQPSDMFIAEAVNAAVRNVEFRMSNGKQKRDLIFVDDVVRGLIAAASASDVEGRIINLGSGLAHPLCDVARRIWELAGAQAPLLIGARQSPAEELYDTWADIRLARQLLDWVPGVSLESGLERTVECEREQRGPRVQACQVT
ncbi:MAG: NAD(P)-dependent oxidoreductase [Acidobacteriota bacterium]